MDVRRKDSKAKAVQATLVNSGTRAAKGGNPVAGEDNLLANAYAA